VCMCVIQTIATLEKLLDADNVSYTVTMFDTSSGISQLGDKPFVSLSKLTECWVMSSFPSFHYKQLKFELALLYYLSSSLLFHFSTYRKYNPFKKTQLPTKTADRQSNSF